MHPGDPLHDVGRPQPGTSRSDLKAKLQWMSVVLFALLLQLLFVSATFCLSCRTMNCSQSKRPCVCVFFFFVCVCVCVRVCVLLWLA